MKNLLVEQIISQVEAFPSMPAVASKLLSMVEKSDTSIDDVVRVLRNDPGLTANILKLTNSAYFGLPSRVGSVSKALTLLGLKKLNQLIMASCVTAIMNQSVTGYGLPAGDLWRHSVAVSVAAEDLVRELGLREAEEIFTAALLHDMGKVVMGRFVQDKLAEIAVLANTDQPFEVAERAILGTDHAEIGAKVLEKWSLPDNVVQAVRWHHQPDSSPKESMVTDIVHVANMLCLMMGIGMGIGGLQHEPSPVVVKRLGLSARQLEKVASRTLQWAQELAESLDGQSA